MKRGDAVLWRQYAKWYGAAFPLYRRIQATIQRRQCLRRSSAKLRHGIIPDEQSLKHAEVTVAEATRGLVRLLGEGGLNPFAIEHEWDEYSFAAFVVVGGTLGRQARETVATIDELFNC